LAARYETVPAGDPRALAGAIEKLLGDEKRLAVMGEECRRVALEGYTLEIQAKRYAKLYEEMLRGD